MSSWPRFSHSPATPIPPNQSEPAVQGIWRSQAGARAGGGEIRPAVAGRGGKPTRGQPVRARHRRMLAKWLRRTANRKYDLHPVCHRRELLLCDRIASVRSDLLEIAAMLESTHDPEPMCVATLRNLLSNGCESPLCNPEVHISELRATLYYVRSQLTQPSSR
jgi:hypothetical protein